MYKITLIIITIMLLPKVAIAGRHSIARDEATNIVNNRFAQFYRDEASRKQAELKLMEQAINDAKNIEAAMLRELEQNTAHDRIISADELERRLMSQDEVVANEPNETANETPIDVPQRATGLMNALDVTQSSTLNRNAPLDSDRNIDTRLTTQQNPATSTTTAVQGNAHNHSLGMNTARTSSSIQDARVQQLTNNHDVITQAASHGSDEQFATLNRDTNQRAAVASTFNANSVMFNASDANTRSLIASNYFDIARGTIDNNPFLFLQELQNKEPEAQLAGIKEVVNSFNNLPNRDKLAEEFAKDLAKMSPSMAKQFTMLYKAKFKNTNSDPNNKNSKTNSHKNHKKHKLLKKDLATQGSQNKSHPIKTFNSITNYNFNPNKLYQIYTAPNKITAIQLAVGEKIIGTPICGDQTRWRINVLKPSSLYQHLIIQPLKSGITTSITITTNQRLYVLEAISLTNNYMALVKWNYE